MTKKMKIILGLVVAAGVVAGAISYKNANTSSPEIQGIDDDLSIGNRRNNDRRTASRYYLLIITITKRSIDTFIIGSKANYRLMLRFGKSRVCILEMRL